MLLLNREGFILKRCSGVSEGFRRKQNWLSSHNLAVVNNRHNRRCWQNGLRNKRVRQAQQNLPELPRRQSR